MRQQGFIFERRFVRVPTLKQVTSKLPPPFFENFIRVFMTRSFQESYLRLDWQARNQSVFLPNLTCVFTWVFATPTTT